ncbi:MAG: hypothetical protein LUC17_00480 [Oscillospiraceae bacterium]|nr:hypothetical protein [Oscillospiraceae bacterium]
MADENEKDVKKTAEGFLKDIGDKLGHASDNKDNAQQDAAQKVNDAQQDAAQKVNDAQQQNAAATDDKKSDIKDKIVGAVKDEAEKIVNDKGKDIVGDVENLFKGKK